MDVLQAFADLVAQPDEEIDLARAATMIGLGTYPGTDVDRCLRALDDLSVGISDLAGLRRRLFADMGFAGDRAGYNDPDNAFLHRVLERRLGIPVTLSILTMEVGRRAGVPLEPIAMPGHFLLWEPYSDRFLDAFNGGALIDEAGCEVLFRLSTGAGDEVVFTREMLPLVSNAGILVRILGLLAQRYRAAGNPAALEWALRMRLALPEVSSGDILELADAMAAQGRSRAAAAELETWARLLPDLETSLHTGARRLIARLN